jgi:hypothetical protein
MCYMPAIASSETVLAVFRLHVDHDGVPVTDYNREVHRELAREGLMVVGHSFTRGRDAFYVLTPQGRKLSGVLDRMPSVASPAESDAPVP